MNALIVAGADEDAALALRVLQDNGDLASHCEDVPEALSRVAQEGFDVAFVSLSMPRGDGLALVHHLRALYPGLDLVAMASPDEVEEAGSAMALGVASTVVTPLTGDDVLVAVDRLRERRILLQQKLQGRAREAAPARLEDILRRCAAFVAQPETARVAAGFANVCEDLAPARAVAVYLAASGSEVLRRHGDAGALPEVLEGDACARLRAAEEPYLVDGCLHLPLRHQDQLHGALLLQPRDGGPVDDEALRWLRATAALAAAALEQACRLQAASRGGIRDGDTGAYTFAYFGDVAARELDRALRNHHSFVLLTLQFEALGELHDAGRHVEARTLRRALAQCVGESVRVSDVVATRDERTFSLLLPETELLGGLACRRRILQAVAGLGESHDAAFRAAFEKLEGGALAVGTGLSVFPGDGEDLSELVKLSRRRAERARDGLWRRMGLDRLGFWEGIDRLLEAPLEAGSVDGVAGLTGRASMSRGLLSKIVESLIRDAARDGHSGVLYLAGDSELAASASRAVDGVGQLAMRTWLLGPARSVRDPAARFRLPLTDSRLNRAFLVLCITERGGYCLAARGEEPGELGVFHSSDLDVVEGLVTALQRQYHLQPELR